MPAVRIALERLLYHQCQAIKALAHVGVAGRQPDPRAARDRDHRRRLPFASAFISADTVAASTAPVIRIRPPPANSISITPRRRCTDVMTSTAFVIGLVLVIALGLDPNES